MGNALIEERIIIDAETGEKHCITPEKTQRAECFVQKIKMDFVDICISLKTVKDEKLYLFASRNDGGIGFETFNDFIIERFNMSLRTVQKYLSIADSFLTVPHESREKLFEISFTALYELSQLPEETKEEMIQSGTLILSNGDELSIDELVKMKGKEIVQEIKELRKQNRAIDLSLKEADRIHEEELGDLRKENDILRRSLERVGNDRETIEFYQNIKNSDEAILAIGDAQATLHSAFNKIKGLEINDTEIAKALKGFLTYAGEMIQEIESTIQHFEVESIVG